MSLWISPSSADRERGPDRAVAGSSAGPARHTRTRIRHGWPVLVVAAAMLLAGCASSRASRPISINSTPASASGYDGDVLGSGAVTLTSTDLAVSFQSTTGSATTLAALGKGKLMLLYLGYTHCPDVCPTTMADLGVALRQIPTVERYHTQVVFVTSDPARDTTPVMTAWLNHFDSGLPVPFVGLTAAISQIDKVATSVGVPLSPPVKNPDGSITVQHGAQTLAFIKGKADLLWTAGTTPQQYAHDIMQLFNSGGLS